MPELSSESVRESRRTTGSLVILLQIGFIAPCIATSAAHSPKWAFSACPARERWRNVFCYTFRSLAAPSLSLVSSPVKSRLSSPASSAAAIACFSRERYTAHGIVMQRLLCGVGAVLWQRQNLLEIRSLASSGCASSVRRRRCCLLYARGFHVAQ